MKQSHAFGIAYKHGLVLQNVWNVEESWHLNQTPQIIMWMLQSSLKILFCKKKNCNQKHSDLHQRLWASRVNTMKGLRVVLSFMRVLGWICLDIMFLLSLQNAEMIPVMVWLQVYHQVAAATNLSRQGSLVMGISSRFVFCIWRGSVTLDYKRNKTEYSSGS